MVTNRRSPMRGIGGGSPSSALGKMMSASAFGDGGVSEGQRNTRSMRSCAPGCRSTLIRMAPGGTLNRTPATVTGTVGASSETCDLGQVGHNR